MESASLLGTPFATAYAIFGSANDEELISTLSNIFLLSIIGIFVWDLVYPSVKYGKLGPDNSPKRGMLTIGIPSRTSWMIFTMPGFVTPMLLIVITPGKQLWNFCNFSALTLYMIHYVNRSLIYSRQISKEAKPMELWHFLTFFSGGLFIPFLQSHHIVNVLKTIVTTNSYIGLGLCIGGMGINIYHDKLLTNLRKESPKSGPTIYKIPRGGLFEYVSCANLMGEIIEWWGFAILTKGYPQVLLGVWSTVFLVFRSIDSHKFYKKTFPKNYPANRKAVIPFLL